MPILNLLAIDPGEAFIIGYAGSSWDTHLNLRFLHTISWMNFEFQIPTLADKMAHSDEFNDILEVDF